MTLLRCFAALASLLAPSPAGANPQSSPDTTAALEHSLSAENDIDAGAPVDRVVADFDEFLAKKRASLEAIRRRSARRDDLQYIDVVGAMLENGRPKDIFGPDGLHLNSDGYVIRTRIVRGALTPTVEALGQTCRRASHA